jgi:hypothetical protein
LDQLFFNLDILLDSATLSLITKAQCGGIVLLSSYTKALLHNHLGEGRFRGLLLHAAVKTQYFRDR